MWETTLVGMGIMAGPDLASMVSSAYSANGSNFGASMTFDCFAGRHIGAAA